MFVMSADPGLTGAIALYDSEKHVVQVEDMPTTAGRGKKQALDLQALFGIVDRFATFADVCVVEQVGGMPKQGGQFRFGYVAGGIDMAAVAAGIELVKVGAAQWKLRAGLPPGGDRAQRKAASRALAAKLFPTQAELFARVKDDGRAEAVLIAWVHAQRQKLLG